MPGRPALECVAAPRVSAADRFASAGMLMKELGGEELLGVGFGLGLAIGIEFENVS